MTQPDPPSPAAAPRRSPWRRLFQYRLRTILILTTVIAISLGWWSYLAKQQRDAVAALTKAGVMTGYDYMLPWNNNVEWPSWVMNEKCRDYFANILFVRWGEATDADLERLRDVPMIKILQLNGSEITDDGLKQLKPLSSLTNLELSYTHISDAGLEHLSGMYSLRKLTLYGTKVTDAGVARLKHALPECDIHSDHDPP